MPEERTSDGRVRFRNHNPSKDHDASPSEHEDLKQDYTQDQLIAVEKINKCKDYYEILGVSKDCGDSDLRRQYKKLALQFHPDKNKTPGAVEAFKAIGNAFSILSDPPKRKQYDTYGLEGANRVPRFSEHSDNEFTYGFQSDVNPEDLFNMFFNAGFTNGTTYVRRGHTWHHFPTRPTHSHHQQEDTRSVFVQILPLLILITLSLLSNLFVSDPPFSLVRTQKYIYERQTSNLEVTYYVKENFASEYKGRINNLEKQIEEEYLINLRSSCFKERNYKESMIWKAKTFRDVNLENKARELRTPSCDAMYELYQTNRV